MSEIYSNIEKLGVMIDCSRNSVMNLPALKKLLPILAKAGYNFVHLYTEDTFEVNNELYFGYMRGRYTKAELKEIDAYAQGYGIELIPCIQTLAHYNQLFRWPEYSGINDTGDILLVGEERTYKLIENIFDTLAECFTSRNVHIGMDEAHMLGLGKYLDKHGYTERAEIMLPHLTRVNEIANSRGFNCAMWSDMFFYMAFGGTNYAAEEKEIPEEIKARIPKNIKLIYWDYYSIDKQNYVNNIRSHKKMSDDIIFAGGLWTWVGLTPCNYYGIQAADAGLSACLENGVSEAFFTMWGDNGGSCSPFSVLPGLVFAAEAAKGNRDIKKIKARFKEIVGMDYDTFLALDLPNFLSDGQDKTRIHNPSKYLFYNDPLMGVYDSTVTEGCGEVYKNHAAKLKKGETNDEYGFIFKTLRLLCNCLYYKADLGIRTRRLYLAQDKEGLKDLIKERYKPLLKKLEQFYDAFAEYWDRLFKPHGFDVMDIRIGGAIRRTKHAIKKLERYITGEVDSIPELNEKLLDVLGGGETFTEQTFCMNAWGLTVTPNIV